LKLLQAVQTKLERVLNEKSTLEAELHDLLAQKLEAEEKLEESDQSSKIIQANLKTESEQKLINLLGMLVYKVLSAISKLLLTSHLNY